MNFNLKWWKSKPKSQSLNAMSIKPWYVNKECPCKFCKESNERITLVNFTWPEYDKVWVDHNIFMAGRYGE